MKIVYSAAGQPPAAVVLDTPEELSVVFEALMMYIPVTDEQAEMRRGLISNLGTKGPA